MDGACSGGGGGGRLGLWAELGESLGSEGVESEVGCGSGGVSEAVGESSRRLMMRGVGGGMIGGL